ncbi:gamma-glutamyltransferase [candidate division KSB1 bacterium]|nr:gamma-glutamyltransferase [candidate division KSB1 bacterium]
MRKHRGCAISFVVILFIIQQFPVHAATGTSGMVVTANPIASEFGVEILQSGGNAIDAAVGVALALGVVEPHGSGLGGGGAMLVYFKDGDSLSYINYYACAPQTLPADFKSSRDSHAASSVLVPGTVAGLYTALSRYGSLSWRGILLLLIEKLQNGFPVDDTLQKEFLDSYEWLLMHKQTRSIYLENDLPPDTGYILKNPRIMATLQKLADGGPDVFYKGEIADSIDAVMIKQGGSLHKTDLMRYTPREVRPITGSYRGYDIYSAPPPQSGATVIEILNILEFQYLATWGAYPESATTFHFMIEAMKRGYSDRIDYISDPNFQDVPVDMLVSKKFAEARYRTIDLEKAVPFQSSVDTTKSETPGDVFDRERSIKQGSTTHVSVVDKDGNAVSLTQTLNYFWGSGISVCGFLLNNGMTVFSKTTPGNQAAPGRQPRTTITPTMLFNNGQLRIVIGTPGGGRIISTMVEVICNVLDFNKSAELANRTPRFYCGKLSEPVAVEALIRPEILDSLRAKGHDINELGELDLYFGGVQLILIDPATGELIGSSDPRRSGVAVGY